VCTSARRFSLRKRPQRAQVGSTRSLARPAKRLNSGVQIRAKNQP
jgi:hypothetical protein